MLRQCGFRRAHLNLQAPADWKVPAAISKPAPVSQRHPIEHDFEASEVVLCCLQGGRNELEHSHEERQRVWVKANGIARQHGENR